MSDAPKTPRPAPAPNSAATRKLLQAVDDLQKASDAERAKRMTRRTAKNA
jgi:hypothetical protein